MIDISVPQGSVLPQDGLPESDQVTPAFAGSFETVASTVRLAAPEFTDVNSDCGSIFTTIAEDPEPGLPLEAEFDRGTLAQPATHTETRTDTSAAYERRI
ncbi:MAG: hypothetical protein ABSG69_04650 [Candidatus Acidiferrum sp.]|jgi:hypothetical protein